MAQKTKITALYERLSRDDELQGPSKQFHTEPRGHLSRGISPKR